ncbi:DUF4868 domain-containing protein [Alteromonas sp. 5E99-2]|uniref:Kiwa anti-phage protein KwaB-like domain-containing protein n=1 Tax=Alteromonas sp. 5E99-2 TaxID=2817683 RepID=UPI001A9878AE|nr:Kiwa anti-phage protein KwaB-like domain-containing protein [Alteromonas sp. 5E99-2]MBO1256702.1 DUF4868 domain-containing protein [Alteromonas sp. 5E99-2]
MENLEQLLVEIKKDEWANATVSLFVAKRQLRNKQAKYTVYQVNADDSLQLKLRNIANQRISKANNAAEYDFNTADLDSNMLGIESSETDFQKILESITADPAPNFITEYKDLVDTWVYIARFDVQGNEPLFSVRKVNEAWSTKKVNQLVSAFFHDNMLVDLKQEHVFRIDGKVDFFAHQGVIFIADKKNFESALNFRAGMENNRDLIVEEFKETELFVDADEIKNLVGNSLPRLRKLSQVKKSGYYKDVNFLTKLRQVSNQEGWGIKYSEDGKLIVDEDDIDTVLRVLNNDRLKSMINDENFDVDVKHKLAE